MSTLASDNSAGSFRAAIEAANAAAGPDTITFSAMFNTAQTISLGGAELLISDDLTITGPGAAGTAPILTIDGGGTSRVFNIASGTAILNVTLSGMRVTGGSTTTGAQPSPDGGGIFVANETVTLDRMNITGNTVAGGPNNSGAGVSVFTGGSLTVLNSSISGNTTSGCGGGIYFYNGGSLRVESSTISGNTANSTGNIAGGGLYFYGATGAGGLTFVNSTIQGNTATTGSGGGILLTNFNGNATIQNCTITGNSAQFASTADGRGGGGLSVRTIAAGAAPVITIQSSIISGNLSNPLNNRLDIAAAAGVTVNVDHSAIGSSTGFTYTDPTGTNLPLGAALNLGALQDNGGPTFTMALPAGSPAVDAGSNPAIPALTTDQRGHARSQGAGVDIGAYELDAGVPTASGSFSNVNVGGATSYTFQVTFADPSSPILLTTLGNNDIRVTGPGGFNTLATLGTVDSSNPNSVIVTYSFIPPGGAWVATANGTYTATVEAGSVTNSNAVAVPATAVGSFIVAIPTILHVTTNADSGAGSLRDAITQANTNQAGTADTIVFDGPVFGTNPVTITLESALPAITQSLTINGPGPAANLLTIARNAAAATQFGVLTANGSGVLDVFLANMVITGGNTTGVGGAGIDGDGGGIFAGNENLTLDNVRVVGNTSATEGGGIAFGVGAGLLTVRNSTISGNTSNGVPTVSFAGAGGGIYFASGGSLLIENSTISGNTSTASDGGGVYFFGAVGAGGFTIRNSTIANNTAGLAGGGIGFRTTTGTLNIQHSTITGNTANGGVGGGGIAQSTGTAAIVTVFSTIVSGNTSAAAPDVFSPGTVNVNFSAVGSNTGFTPSGTSANNLAEGAVLNLGTLGNNGGPTETIALGTGSLAINAGPATTPGILFDQRGAPNNRVSGVAADIGAFEVQAGGVAPTVLSTVVNNSTSNQRSRVSSLAVTFSNAVTFAGAVANAFTLVRNGNGAIVNFTATVTVNGLGQTVVTLDNFVDGTAGVTQFGSLADGNYTLTALADQISNGGTNMAANYTFGSVAADRLYRFYGDITGDRRVDIADFGFFSAGYLQGPGANVPSLDFNQDGRLDITDFGQFSVRFFTSLP